MKAIVLMLCGAIGFFILAQESKITASHSSYEKEQAAQRVVEVLDQLKQNDAAILGLLAQHGLELAEIEDCSAAELAEVKTKLVSIVEQQEEAKTAKAAEPPKAELDSCQCDCTEKLRELTDKVELLQAQVILLEARPVYPAKTSSGAGSTGSGGSTGSLKAAGGSTGSVVQTAEPRTPLRSAAKAVLQAPVQAVQNVAQNVAQNAMSREALLDLHDSLHEGDGIQRPGHWTFPGDLATHLAQEHGQPVQFMMRPVQSFYPTKRTAASSSCPGGNCPQQAQSVRRGFLGFRR